MEINPAKWKGSKAFVYVGIAALAWGAILLTLRAFNYELRINVTPSVSVGLYLLDRDDFPTERGQLVVARHDKPQWATDTGIKVPDGIGLLKYVNAMPGDYLRYEDPEIRRCDTPESVFCPSIAVRKPNGFEGRQFPPYDLPNIVPDGQYFLSTPTDIGYDSRYLGFFGADTIIGVAHPIITW